MIITAQTDTPIRLPLETAFGIDISALLPEGTTLTSFYIAPLHLGGGRGIELTSLSYTEGPTTPEGGLTVLDFMPGERWEGFALDPMDPQAPVAELYLYVEGGTSNEPIVVPILPSVAMATEEPSFKGTAGRDTIAFDAQDPTGAHSVALIDTSGGSDRASVVNGAGILLGRSGNDTLTGWDLDDALFGGGGLDVLFGGAGNDRLLGLGDDDRIFGGNGRDFLAGGLGNDSLTGGADADTLSAGGGNDTLRGETGDDQFLIAERTGAPDTRPAQTTLAYGGDGDDRFEIDSMFRTDARAIEGPEGDGGMVELYGGAGNDWMYLYLVAGGALYGGIGNDQITVGMGDSLTGTVTIYGGEGNDGLFGGRNTDIYGGAGNDFVSAVDGTKVSTGDGDDTVYIQYDFGMEETATLGAEVYGGMGNDIINGNQRNDTLHGGLGDDTITGLFGDDTLLGGAGADSLSAGSGNDMLYGGADDDTLYSSDDMDYTPEDIANGLVGLADVLYGGSGNDFVIADRAGHTLYGDEGNDYLTVVLNNTYATGSSILNGGAGDDTLQAAGFSGVEGGAGADVFFLDIRNDATSNTMIVNDFVRGEDRLDFLSLDGTATDLIGPIASFEGETLPNSNGQAAIYWQSGGSNQVTVYIDANGDGQSDGRFVVTGIGDIMASDFGIVQVP